MTILCSVRYETTNSRRFYFTANNTKNNVALEKKGAVSLFYTDSQPPALDRLDMLYSGESADGTCMGTSGHKVKCCSTFREPCIVLYSYNERQRDALFLKLI
jgi:hypothetical protein